MRLSRGLIGGTVLGAALAAGGGGWLAAGEELALRRAEAFAAALEARLPPGSDVSWGALEADPLGGGGGMRLRDVAVRLGPAGAASDRITAAVVELAGDPGFRPDGGAAISAMRARGIAGEGAGGARASVASMELRDFNADALAGVLGGRLPDGGVGAFAAEAVELTEGADRLALARVAFDGLGPDGLRGLALDGLATAAASAGTGGRTTTATIERARLGALEWSGVDGRAVADAAGRFRAAQDAGPAGRRGPRRDEAGPLFAGVDMLLAVAGGRATGLELSGLGFASDDPASPLTAARLERLAVAELSSGRLGPVEAAGIEVGGDETRATAGSARYDAVIDAFPLEELRTAAATLPRTPEGAARLRAALAGIAGRYEAGVADLVVDNLADGARLGFGRLVASGSTGREREENRLAIEALALDFGGAAAADPALARAARHLGNLTGGLVAAWSADRTAGTVALDQLGFELDNLGALDASAAGTVAGPAAGGALSPGLDPAATSLSRARLVYTDRSLVGRLLAAWGEPGDLPPDMVADALAGMAASPEVTPWLDRPAREALASFLRRPGRLEVELAPAAPVALASALALALRTPAALPAGLGLRVTATPP